MEKTPKAKSSHSDEILASGSLINAAMSSVQVAVNQSNGFHVPVRRFTEIACTNAQIHAKTPSVTTERANTMPSAKMEGWVVLDHWSVLLNPIPT